MHTVRVMSDQWSCIMESYMVYKLESNLHESRRTEIIQNQNFLLPMLLL